MSVGVGETSFLELFDKLARVFVSNGCGGYASTTVVPFRLWAEEDIFERRENEVCKKLKFSAFDTLLDLKRKRDPKLDSGTVTNRKREEKEKSIEKLVFESAFTCPVREERKLFLELLSGLVKQLESKAGCSRAVLWLHFLASLQNGADSVPNADSLTPVQVSQALLRDRVAKTSTLKRFFEVDDVPDGSQHRMFDAASKRRFTQFFTPSTHNPMSIGASTSRPPSAIPDRSEERVYQFGRMLPDWQNSATAHTSAVDVDEGFSEESGTDELLYFNSKNGLVAYEYEWREENEQIHRVDVWDRLRVQMQESSWDDASRPSRSWDYFGRLFSAGRNSHPQQYCFATDYINDSNHSMNISRHSTVGTRRADSERGADAMSCIDMIRVNSESGSVFVDEQLIISHCLSVLIGVSSSTFLFQISDSDFVVQRNLRVKDLSPQSLRSLLEDFADAGTCFERLSTFSETVRGFFVGQLALEVNKYLKTVHALVVKIYESIFLPENCHELESGSMELKRLGGVGNRWVRAEKKMSLLKLHIMTKQMRDVLMFLLQFVSAAPRGHALLSYIYRKVLDYVGTPWYDSVLKILATCSQPYISLIENWIYHGNLNEQFYSSSCEEFMINCEPEYLNWRSRKFWTKGFTLNINNDKSNVPLFLRDHVEQMFACGKTILLLKLCQPQHYLVSNFLRTPSLKMTFKWQEVQEIEDECIRYTKQLEKLIQAEKDATEEKENEEERRKQEMVAQIRRVATLEFTELAKRVALHNEDLRVKRAAELLELKQEMEKDLQRRRDQVAEEKRKDGELTELGLARDRAELERMKSFEEQARQELIAYYEELGAEAMLKEQRALWRIRRRQLDEKRNALLTKPIEESFPMTNFNLETTITSRLTENDENLEIIDFVAETKNLESAASGSRKISSEDEVVSDPISITAVDNELTIDVFEHATNNEVNGLGSVHEEEQNGSSRALEEKNDSKSCKVEKFNESILGVQRAGSIENVLSEGRESSLESPKSFENKVFTDQNDSKEMTLNRNFLEETLTGDTEIVPEVLKPEAVIRTSSASDEGNSNGRVWNRPTIRVGNSINQGTEGILSWPEHLDSEKEKSETDENSSPDVEETDDGYPYPSNVFLNDGETKIAPYVKFYPELFAYPTGDLCTKIYSTNSSDSNDDFALPLLTSSEIKPKSDVILSPLISPEKVENFFMVSKTKDGSSMKTLPLAVLMKRLIVQPLEKQTDLANSCARDLFFIDHQLWFHFEALRRTLLLADPEFAHGFCTSAFAVFDSASHVLLSRGSRSMNPTESPVGNDNRVLSIAFFSRALNFAVERSRWNKKDVLFERLQVKLRIRQGTEDFMDLYHADCFSCIALLYRVNWPLNVIISDTCVEKYIKIFHLLLSLRRLSFILSKLFFHLKKTERLFDTACSPQFAKVQFGRHIMQHNSNVLSDYLHEQLLSLSWNEFKQAMDKARSVDDMHFAHANYLNTMICRAMLNEKASKVLKIIKSMMTQSITFERQVSLGSWTMSGSTGQLEHSNFHALMQSVKSFQNHSKFLNKIVTKLCNAGYQPHLQNLLLKLDFNGYFSK